MYDQVKEDTKLEVICESSCLTASVLVIYVEITTKIKK